PSPAVRGDDRVRARPSDRIRSGRSWDSGSAPQQYAHRWSAESPALASLHYGRTRSPDRAKAVANSRRCPRSHGTARTRAAGAAMRRGSGYQDISGYTGTLSLRRDQAPGLPSPPCRHAKPKRPASNRWELRATREPLSAQRTSLPFTQSASTPQGYPWRYDDRPRYTVLTRRK